MEHFEIFSVYVNKGGGQMKKLMTLVLLLTCVLGLIGCNRDKYSCRIIDDSDSLVMTESTLTEPFVSTSERNQLIEQAVSNHLKCKPDQFTYEITSEALGFYESKNTMLYWLHVVDTEGFAHVIGVVIQD